MATTHSGPTSLARAASAGAPRTVRIGVWISTGLFALVFTLSGAMLVLAPPEVVARIRHLGYPDYFRELLGVAKLLGVAAIVVPLPAAPALREWAYAGCAFTCLAAAASHGMSGDAAGQVASPLVALALLMTSYRLRRRVAERS